MQDNIEKSVISSLNQGQAVRLNNYTDRLRDDDWCIVILFGIGCNSQKF
jgi:hypothetical protein